MTTVVNRSALVPFSAEQMFALVNDIGAYPEFLPWCKTTNILERTSDKVKASIEIAKAGINKSFTTCNENTQPSLIKMNLVEGPFKHLEGFWRFDVLNEKASKVSLDIEFEFSNKILEKTVGPVFGHICNTMVEAFVRRARETYGRK